MTDLLSYSEVQCYYSLTSEQRRNWFSKVLPSYEDYLPFPHSILSLFEVHLAYMLLLRDGEVEGIESLIECWDEFARLQRDYRWGDSYLTLLEVFAEEPDFLFKVFQEIGPSLERNSPDVGEHQRMWQRLRHACEVMANYLKYESRECWETLGYYRSYFPAELPNRIESRDDDSVVIDTNSLIALLMQLDPVPSGSVRLESYRNLTAEARQYCQELLNTFERTDKIIIPVCVLEECERVARKHGYMSVLRALENMVESEDPFWASFEFEPFSLEILRSFLEVYNRCAYLTLADAIIVAHAVKSKLPLISEDEQVRRASEQFCFLDLKLRK